MAMFGEKPRKRNDMQHGNGTSSAPLWILITLLTVIAGASVLFPVLGDSIVNAMDFAKAYAFSICSGIFPLSLHSVCQKGIDSYLSPWLFVLVALVLATEKYIPADSQQPVFSVGLIQDFVAWFVLNMAPRAATVIVIIGLTGWVYTNYLEFATIDWTLKWNETTRIVAALLLLDFLAWFHHYIRHKVKLFWFFHTVHHSQTQMNMFTDLRVHFVEYLIAKPISLLPLFMLNLNIEFAFWIVLLQSSFTRFYHANLRTNLGLLKYIFVTPQSHRIHHSREQRHQDMNFGVIFSVWDRIFGTQWTKYEEYPQTGIADPCFPLEERVGWMWSPVNYVRQVLYPFKQAVALIKGTGSRAPGPGTGPH